MNMKTLIEKIKILNLFPINTAILCVDCQNSFTLRCSNELPVEETDEVWIKSINNFLKLAKKEKYKIFASKDDHPKDHISFKEWPMHCVKNTYGNKLFINYVDYIVKKGSLKETDSYSAFYENFEDTPNELDLLLKNNKIKNLIIFGLAGDICVLETIKSSIKKGYNTFVIKDFIKSVNKKDIDSILKENKIKTCKSI
ncbi:bifunctional pyrazinamidase/nicotinamidase [Tepiditoga spiralis]|uniref:nicotinamidase n=1 Tax=Tepiditoga spiralis TaxID=2108365 RepID=A0A7G1G3N9_9BACT|nr:isochorismatase family protein [Tepiditoga spiralis]BBE30981.1 bifunctional pyrazinamidase/nicotinamidase [Tepiditoga spiralis]